MWAVSLLHLELSSLQTVYRVRCVIAAVGYALTLPKIPVAEKKATTSLASKLGLDAFVLLFKIHAWLSFPLRHDVGRGAANYHRFGNPFLHDFARNPEFADSFVVKIPVHFTVSSQMAEVGFILTIPFF